MDDKRLSRYFAPFRLALLLQVGGLPAGAVVPTEIPAQRTSQVFSPFYFQFLNTGEGVFNDPGEGPACRGYANLLDFRQTGFPGTGLGSATNLIDLVRVLHNPAGIMFAMSHSGQLSFYVYGSEAFASRAEAEGKLLLYQGDLVDNSDPNNLEAVISEVEFAETTKVYTIAVSEKFIRRHLVGQHSVVHLMGCQSSGLAPAFINSSHMVRNFVGIGAVCVLGGAFTNLGLNLSRTVWNGMAGVESDASGYRNMAIGEAVQLARSKHDFNFLDLVSDSAQPNASMMRLYNAPRIVLANVEQDVDANGSFSHQIYKYPVGATQYPYNSGANYPEASTGAKIAKTGPIRASIRFSEPIDKDWQELTVELRFPSGTSVPLTGGTWSNAGLPSGVGLFDTWTHTFNLPNDPGLEGEVRLAVRARNKQCVPSGLSAAQDFAVQELDLDGDGRSAPGTYDTSVTFAVNRRPRISRADQNGSEGPFEGDANSPESSPLLTASQQVFTLDQLGVPTHTFTIFSSLDRQSIFFQHQIPANTSIAAFPVDLPDGRNYIAEVREDESGISTAYYFKIDANPPLVSIGSIAVSPNTASNALLLGVAGTATDPGSGLSWIRLAQGSFQYDPETGALASITPGNVDEPGYLASAPVISGAESASFLFPDLPQGAPFSLGARDVIDTLSAPPVSAGIEARTRTVTRPAPFNVSGTVTAGTSNGDSTGGGPGTPAPAVGLVLGSYLRSVHVATRMDQPTQTGAINVYARSIADTQAEDVYGAILQNSVPTLARTFVGTISGDTTLDFTPGLMGRGQIQLELDGPSLNVSEPGAAPTVSAFRFDSDVFGLETSPPGVPIQSAVTVPAGDNIAITIDEVTVKISQVTRTGTLFVRKVPYKPGFGIRTIPPGTAFAVDTDIQFIGPLEVYVTVPAGDEERARIFQHEERQSFVNVSQPPDIVAHRVVARTFSNSTFVVMLNEDGSSPPSGDAGRPTTSISFDGGTYSNGSDIFISENTNIVLDSQDDFSGVEETLLAVNPPGTLVDLNAATRSQFEVYGGNRYLQEGHGRLAWGSFDRAQNASILQSMPVSVDGTPAQAVLSVVGPTVDEPTRRIIGPQTHLLFQVQDPISNGVSAGPLVAGVLVDQTLESCGFSEEALPTPDVSAPQGTCANPTASDITQLSGGTRTVNFFGIDNVLNLEAPRSTTVVVDAEQPSAAITSPALVRDPRPGLSAELSDSLAGVATGTLRMLIDGQPVPFSSAFETSGGGLPGAWQSGPLLPIGVHFQGFTLLNGRLYSIGGHTGTSGPRAEVNYSALDAGGVPGAWTPTTSLPAARYDLVAVSALGRLYALGGTQPGAGLATNTLFYAKPEPNGSISAWSAAALPGPLAGATSLTFTAAGTDLFAIGGFDANGQNQKSVYVSRLNPVTGVPGPWQRRGDMPQTLGQASAAVWNGRVYVLGGMVTGGSTTSNEVYSAAIQDGDLVDWRSEREMPLAVRGLGAAAIQGRLYALGGLDSAGAVHDKVYSAAILPDGRLDVWQPGVGLPAALAAFGMASTESAFYVSGGFTLGNVVVRDTRYALGTLGKVVSASLVAAPPEDLPDGNHVLSVEGVDRVANAAQASSAFTIDATPPEVSLSVGGLAVSSTQVSYFASDQLLLAAQFSDAGTGVDAQTAVLLLDGATLQAGVSPLQATPAEPLNPGRHLLEARVADLAGNMAAAAAEFVVDTVAPEVLLTTPVAGAVVGAAPLALAASFSDGLSGLATGEIALSVDGSLLAVALDLSGGQWESASPLPVGVHFQGFAHLGGRLYSIGGHDGSAGARAEVNHSALDAGGVPGPWTPTASLPAARYDLAAVPALGRLYALGGTLTGAGLANSNLYYARPETGGAIASWTTAGLPAPIAGLSALAFAAVDTHLFALGGFNNSAQMQRSVWASRLDPATGAPEGWVQRGDMPQTLGQAAAAVWNDRVYVLGGMVTGGETTSKKVYSASIQNGDLVGWREERAMPLAVRALGAAARQGRLYAVGGLDAAGAVHDEVYSALIDEDGRLGDWQPEARLPAALAAFGMASTDSAFYVSGGFTFDNGSRVVTDTRYLLLTGRAEAAATAEGLVEGPHEARAAGEDRAGNAAFSSATFYVDLTAPHTDLVIHAPSRAVGDAIYVLGAASVSFAAVDGPSGVAAGAGETSLAVDGTSVTLDGGYHFVSRGTHELRYQTPDLVGNMEVAASSTVKFDADAPSAVTNLFMAALSSHTVKLTWTAPGDDGEFGAIADAQVRLAFGTDPDALAEGVGLSSGALVPGQSLVLTRSGLSEDSAYYARVYTRDTAGNLSAASSLATARTFFVNVSNDNVASLSAPVEATVTEVQPTSVPTAFTAAVDAGLSPAAVSFYELQEDLAFEPEAPAVISFVFDWTKYDPQAISIYTVSDDVWTSESIFNQSVALLDGSTYLAVISGEILHTSLYAPMVRDNLPPSTSFSILGSSAVLEGRLFAAGGSSGSLSAVDLAPAGAQVSGVAANIYKVGAGAETPFSAPFGLPEGEVGVSFRSTDRNGNAEEAKAVSLFVDGAPPALAYTADQPHFPLADGFGTLSSTVNVTLTWEDPGAGVGAVSLSLDGAAHALEPGAASTTVFLVGGLHLLVLDASDRLGQASRLSLRVAVGDTQPPVTTLTVGAPKFELAGGVVLVAGQTPLTLTAEDFAESGAPSGVAETRFRFQPGEFGVYGTAFTAPEPDGEKVLEFHSLDSAGNVEGTKSAKLLRDSVAPALSLAQEPGLCRLAQGVMPIRGSLSDPHLASWVIPSVGSGTLAADGLLGYWDASGLSGPQDLTLSAVDLLENPASETLRVFAGAAADSLSLAGFNKPSGVAAGTNRIYVSDTNNDAVRVFDAQGNLLATFGDKKALKLNKPTGLAVDGTGNIYVADRNNKRVVKLGPGGALLAEFGGKKVLEKPVAVALAPGKVLVADSHAGELVVFAETGALLSRVILPAAPSSDDTEESRSMALATDSGGGVWVADSAGQRVLRYDASLSLAQTLSGFTRPEGVAVSPSGACLAVVDREEGRARTFDAALGLELASFGQGTLHKPAQAVFTADGQLLVADRNHDALRGFGVPGTPLVVAGNPKGKGFKTASADTQAETSARVGSLEGGRVEHRDRTSVELPAGALAEDQDVTIAEAAQPELPKDFAAAGSPREFGPHGLGFARPVTITLPYDPALASVPSELKVHYWNAERGLWEALDSTVDEQDRTVSAKVMHFSLYQVLAPVRSLAAMADPEASFALRSVYAFPNPAVRSQKPTIHVAVGRADKVTIRFFDVAGTPVHEATLGGNPSVVQDDTGPHYAYEYAWDGHIPSGVYFYTVTAEKAGHGPIKRSGKLAVVR